MNLKRTTLITAITAIFLGIPSLGRAAEAFEGNIDAFTQARLIPVHLTGLSGESASVIRFDLEVMGFEFVEEASAQYLIRGNIGESHLEGHVIDRISKANRLSKRFTGGSVRTRSHALSDAIVLELTGRPGIASTRIAFKGRNAGTTEIYVSDYDGANAFAITQDKVSVESPGWSPGKQTIYYTSYKNGFPDIYRHDLATGNRRSIANYPGSNLSPAASPDGTRLAMILSKAGSPDLYVANADGSNPVRLTTTREDESSPCWSPDGRTICFTSRASGVASLYTIPAAGGTMKRLSTVGALTVTEPAWSPDGKWIAFTVLQRGQFEICLIPAAGGVAKTLTTGEDPSWAPDSRTLIFTREVNYRRVLSLLDVTTQRVKDIQQTLGQCSQPSWAK